jgi:hypothetical protein
LRTGDGEKPQPAADNGEVMRMRQTIFKVLLAVSAVISPPVHAEERPDWPADCKLVRMAQLPMTMKSGHVTIPASVNAKT